MKIIALILVVVHFSGPPEIVRGRVLSVIDGNTLEVLADDNATYKIDLYGVDCPESQQPYGAEAKHLLEETVVGKKVDIIIEGKDRVGTRQAIVIPNGGKDPRIELLSEGLAWTSEHNSIGELETVRREAEVKGIGIWKDKNPVPPWEFRRQQTMLYPKHR